MKKNITVKPHDHPALVEARRKMFDKRMAALLAPKAIHGRASNVDFGKAPAPPRQAWVPPRFEPARADALDHLGIKSRGPI